VRTALLSTPARDLLLEQPECAPRPHITVARKKRTRSGGPADVSSSPSFDGPIVCDRVALIRSSLGSQGPIYTTLASWPLRGSADC
jgi:2'-5' RNA ligase